MRVLYETYLTTFVFNLLHRSCRCEEIHIWIERPSLFVDTRVANSLTSITRINDSSRVVSACDGTSGEDDYCEICESNIYTMGNDPHIVMVLLLSLDG